MKQSEKLEELLKLMQANPELPVIPCVDGDVVGGDDCYCWLGTWGASGIQEYIIGNERTYYREDDISEMNDLLYERYDPELVDDLTEWEDAEAAIRELHARGPEIEKLYLDSKILPGELRALVMVSNCLEREFIHRQLATGQPLHMNVL